MGGEVGGSDSGTRLLNPDPDPDPPHVHYRLAGVGGDEVGSILDFSRMVFGKCQPTVPN